MFNGGDLVRYVIGVTRNGKDILTAPHEFVCYTDAGERRAVIRRTHDDPLYGLGADEDEVWASRLRQT
jgi:hypothetical protein